MMDLGEWLPIRIWPEQGQWWVDWAWFGNTRLTEPFFHDSVEAALRLPLNQALRRTTPIDSLAQWQSHRPGQPPRAFIFHASRCGSTLITQLLTGLARDAVYAEPAALDALLRAHYRDPQAATSQVAWLQGLLSAFGQRRCGGEQGVVVKLDAWNIFEADLVRAACPDVPGIYLYRDPLEIAVSHLRQSGRHMVPGLIGPSPLTRGVPPDCPRVEFIARTVGLLLQAGLERCRAGALLPVNYSELPHAVWGRLAPLLGVPPDAHAMLQQVAMRHAKTPHLPFAADAADKRAAAPAELVTQIETWARPAYCALEQLRLA
ncbi:sulfotransferase family protein [Chitiniphilus purpureus]|uniref:Sulfotransferase family protein n=1 Tax=Chitiniphilus purpureus TaxID=2981137 RepID=A0ABY6DPK0_9NEIS|nr:sulfotransferase family protein [Chitiniphilus sp. CD1]UXY15021.1 sulfotransferase family protein [Chitiniphilus sp. CD1]